MSDKALILAIDTSAAHCAAALLSGETTLLSRTEPMQTGQAERLFPMLEEVLSQTGTTWTDLSALAVATGPGNFTGVRIGVSAARGLALSLNIPAVGVSVPEALAAPVSGPVLVILDARRDRVFAQLFGNGVALEEARPLTMQDLATRQWPEELTCLGFGSDALAKKLGAKAGGEATIADPVQIALCGLAKLAVSPSRPVPVYFRSADAALPSDPPPQILHES